MSPTNLVPNQTPLRDALYALSLAQDVPDADLLETMVQRYPEHAAALTEFAIDLATDALSEVDEEVTADEVATVSADVSRAMSRFQNRRHAVMKHSAASNKPVSPSIAPNNPFASLSRDEFRSFAARIGANNVFVQKLRDRQIASETMSPTFVAFVAEELRAPLDVVHAHFAARGGPVFATAQSFKAEDKPTATEQQTFAEAVASSRLNPAQQQKLMAR